MLYESILSHDDPPHASCEHGADDQWAWRSEDGLKSPLHLKSTRHVGSLPSPSIVKAKHQRKVLCGIAFLVLALVAGLVGHTVAQFAAQRQTDEMRAACKRASSGAVATISMLADTVHWEASTVAGALGWRWRIANVSDLSAALADGMHPPSFAAEPVCSSVVWAPSVDQDDVRDFEERVRGHNGPMFSNYTVGGFADGILLDGAGIAASEPSGYAVSRMHLPILFHHPTGDRGAVDSAPPGIDLRVYFAGTAASSALQRVARGTAEYASAVVTSGTYPNLRGRVWMFLPVKDVTCADESDRRRQSHTVCTSTNRGVVAVEFDIDTAFHSLRRALVFEDNVSVLIVAVEESASRTTTNSEDVPQLSLLYTDSDATTGALLASIGNAQAAARGAVIVTSLPFVGLRLDAAILTEDMLFGSVAVGLEERLLVALVSVVTLCIATLIAVGVAGIERSRLKKKAYQAAPESARREMDINTAMVGYLRHEVKNILNGMTGCLELCESQLVGDPDDSSPRTRFTAHVGDGRGVGAGCNSSTPVDDIQDALRMCGLLRVVVDDILNIYHFEDRALASNSSSFSLRHLEEVLNEAAVLRISSERRSIRMTYSLAACETDSDATIHGRRSVDIDTVSIVADAAHIQQAFCSMMGNAIQHTFDGEVNVSIAVVFENTSSPASSPRQGTLTCTVTDSGSDIPREARPYLFKPFSQLPVGQDGPSGGRGVGLSICAFIAKQLGGSVGCRARGDGSRGCELWVRVPVNVVVAPPNAGDAASDAVPLTQHVTVSSTVPGPHVIPSTGRGGVPVPSIPSSPACSRLGVASIAVAGDRCAPLTPPSPSPTPTADIETPVVRLRPRHLVCDDGAINRTILRRFLERAVDAEVDEACNGAEAVALVIRRGGGQAYDAVWMDVHMPVMDGIEATRRLRMLAQSRNIPIIGVTASMGTLVSLAPHTPSVCPPRDDAADEGADTSLLRTGNHGSGAVYLAGISGEELVDAGMTEVLCKPITQASVRRVCARFASQSRGVGAVDAHRCSAPTSASPRHVGRACSRAEAIRSH